MSQQAPQTTDPTSRILAWWARCGCPRLAFLSDELGEAFLTVLRRLTQAELDAFLSSDPIVVYVRPKSVAAIFRYDVPPPPLDRASSRRLIISINMEYLSHNQEALTYAVALQVARVILGLPAAETPLAHQESQVLRLLKQWGFTGNPLVKAFGFRLRIELLQGDPGVLVTGLQPYDDSDDSIWFFSNDC